MEQIKPAKQAMAPIWEREGSDYPDLIKVPMEDGNVITYRRDITQPGPVFLDTRKLIGILERSACGGYKRKK